MSDEPEEINYEEEIAAAVAILKEDHVIKQGRESRAAIKALEDKYVTDRAKDDERWARWEEKNKEPLTPENDPEPTPEDVPPPPPPVPAAPPEEGGKEKAKKNKGIWFRAEEDD